MAINSVTYGTSFVLNQSVQNLKAQMATLQSQLTTGTKSTSYAGMGTNEGFAIAARSQMSAISASPTPSCRRWSKSERRF
jgi:flagellar hook-associated protein 3 FlgL